jgi:hypothetical protein
MSAYCKESSPFCKEFCGLASRDKIYFKVKSKSTTQTKKSMRHAEASLAQWVIHEGRGLVVVVNKMDLLSGRENAHLPSLVMRAVPEEIQKLLPQVFHYFCHVTFQP